MINQIMDNYVLGAGSASNGSSSSASDGAAEPVPGDDTSILDKISKAALDFSFRDALLSAINFDLKKIVLPSGDSAITKVPDTPHDMLSVAAAQAAFLNRTASELTQHVYMEYSSYIQAVANEADKRLNSIEQSLDRKDTICTILESFEPKIDSIIPAVSGLITMIEDISAFITEKVSMMLKEVIGIMQNLGTLSDLINSLVDIVTSVLTIPPFTDFLPKFPGMDQLKKTLSRTC